MNLFIVVKMFLFVNHWIFRKLSYQFVPKSRSSLYIAKYRNEQKSARFHIVYIAKQSAS